MTTVEARCVGRLPAVAPFIDTRLDRYRYRYTVERSLAGTLAIMLVQRGQAKARHRPLCLRGSATQTEPTSR